MEISCKNTHHCAGTCQSHQGPYLLQSDHSQIESVQTRLQLHTEDGEGGGSTLSTVGEQRGRERREVGWGRDGHTQVEWEQV